MCVDAITAFEYCFMQDICSGKRTAILIIIEGRETAFNGFNNYYENSSMMPVCVCVVRAFLCSRHW